MYGLDTSFRIIGSIMMVEAVKNVPHNQYSAANFVLRRCSSVAYLCRYAPFLLRQKAPADRLPRLAG